MPKFSCHRCGRPLRFLGRSTDVRAAAQVAQSSASTGLGLHSAEPHGPPNRYLPAAVAHPFGGLDRCQGYADCGQCTDLHARRGADAGRRLRDQRLRRPQSRRSRKTHCRPPVGRRSNQCSRSTDAVCRAGRCEFSAGVMHQCQHCLLVVRRGGARGLLPLHETLHLLSTGSAWRSVFMGYSHGLHRRQRRAASHCLAAVYRQPAVDRGLRHLLRHGRPR
ncbi:hypothetical protein D3C72_1545490 [compost metagenome]